MIKTSLCVLAGRLQAPIHSSSGACFWAILQAIFIYRISSFPAGLTVTSRCWSTVWMFSLVASIRTSIFSPKTNCVAFFLPVSCREYVQVKIKKLISATSIRTKPAEAWLECERLPSLDRISASWSHMVDIVMPSRSIFLLRTLLLLFVSSILKSMAFQTDLFFDVWLPIHVSL